MWMRAGTAVPASLTPIRAPSRYRRPRRAAGLPAMPEAALSKDQHIRHGRRSAFDQRQNMADCRGLAEQRGLACGMGERGNPGLLYSGRTPRRAHRARTDAFPDRATDRDHDDRRPRLPRGASQSDPRSALRIGGIAARSVRRLPLSRSCRYAGAVLLPGGSPCTCPILP